MGGELDFARSFWGKKKIIVTDLVVSLASSLGPEHTELVFVLQVNFPAKCKTRRLPLPFLYIELPFLCYSKRKEVMVVL